MPILKNWNNALPYDKPKALITGINGFVGSHLADLLVGEGHTVFGVALSDDVAHLSQCQAHVSLFYGDIRNSQFVESILSQVKPDYIYHLAGLAFVPAAEATPKSVFDVNVLGTLNLLEGVRSSGLKTRVLVVGSGEVYGHVPQKDLPIKETLSLAPSTFYGMTKACADLIAHQYALSFQMDVIRVRPFNHIGPRQSDQFACSSFARQIVEIERGLRKPVLSVGNLDTYRDFTDVRDVVRGYRIILEKAKSGSVYNVGSKKAQNIGDLIRILIKLSYIKKISLEQDASRMRNNDAPMLFSEISALKTELGWEPKIPIEQTLHDLLDYWRGLIK